MRWWPWWCWYQVIFWYMLHHSPLWCVCVLLHTFLPFLVDETSWNITVLVRWVRWSISRFLWRPRCRRGERIANCGYFGWNFRKNLHVQAESFPNSNGSERLDRYGRWQNGWVNGRPVFEPQPYPEFDASFSKSLEYRSMYLLDEARSSSFCVDYIVARGATSVNFTVSHWSFKLIALSMHTGKPGRGENKGPKGCVWPWPWLNIL